MPRNATEYDAMPIFPPEPDIIFHVATGESIPFPVWQDRDSNVKLVKCDICGTFMPLSGAKQSIAALKKHRGNKTCDKVTKNLKNQSAPFTFINSFPDAGPSSLVTFPVSISTKYCLGTSSKNTHSV
jgi:hypothetical protein